MRRPFHQRLSRIGNPLQSSDGAGIAMLPDELRRANHAFGQARVLKVARLLRPDPWTPETNTSSSLGGNASPRGVSTAARIQTRHHQ